MTSTALLIFDTIILLGVLCIVWYIAHAIRRQRKLTEQARQYAYSASSSMERGSMNVASMMRDMAQLMTSLNKESKILKDNHKEVLENIENIISGFNVIAREINDYLIKLGAKKDIDVVEDAKPRRPRFKTRINNPS